MKKLLWNNISVFDTVSFVGLCKNAGKTTAMSSILDVCPVSFGVTSIGRDGERTDVATSTPKPPVFIRKGNLAATAEALFRKCSISKMILESTGVKTPLGEIIIFKAMSDGFVEISGPSTLSGTADVRDAFFSLGAKKVFIDGSISRRSICSPELCKGVVLSTSAALGKNTADVAAKTLHALRLLTIPKASDTAEVLNSPLTDAVAAEIISRGNRSGEIAVKDGSMLILSEKSLTRLDSKGIRLSCIDPINVAAITVNPYSPYGWNIDANELMEMIKSHTDIPVLNVLEENERF